jgi:hypothetical protein
MCFFPLPICVHYAARPCPSCMPIPMLKLQVQAECLCPCSSCTSMTMLHVHGHTAFSCHSSMSMSMSMLHVHAHAACPCPCCMFIYCTCFMSMYMQHVQVHAACLCPCCISMPMLPHRPFSGGRVGCGSGIGNGLMPDWFYWIKLGVRGIVHHLTFQNTLLRITLINMRFTLAILRTYFHKLSAYWKKTVLAKLWRIRASWTGIKAWRAEQESGIAKKLKKDKRGR